MKIAITFNSKDRTDLSEQSMQRLAGRRLQLYWNDGSSTEEGQIYHHDKRIDWYHRTRVTGGPDRAIVFALSQMLSDSSITHVGLLENDVMLGHNWFNDCLALFNSSKTEGLNVGAVSARSFVDRVLVQRDGYCVLHNSGAGHIIFDRVAAEIVLANYRTGWWPENRAVFSQLSGVDLGKFGAFHGNEQPVTADWSWDTILAAHGYAVVAPTPCQVEMIGQDVPLDQQGLELAVKPVEERRDDVTFHRFRKSLDHVRSGNFKLPPCDWKLRMGKSVCILPHHLVKLGAIFTGDWSVTWSQGFGPFNYISGAAGACLTVPVFGTCFFHLSGAGAVNLRDEQSGFSVSPPLPQDGQGVVVAIPGGMMYRMVTLEASAGVSLAGIECEHDQPFNTGAAFDYGALPPVWEKPQ
jgi:hypothetical protein